MAHAASCCCCCHQAFFMHKLCKAQRAVRALASVVADHRSAAGHSGSNKGGGGGHMAMQQLNRQASINSLKLCIYILFR